MCWSGEASAVLATIGLVSTVYVAYKKESKSLWIPLGYFSLMELLQAVTYRYIDTCSSPINQILTVLGYLHIAFQPFFINMVSMYFIPESVTKKIRYLVYSVCFVGTLFMILKLYPFAWTNLCQIGEPMCGRHLCSVSGNWHIAWDLPTNSITWAYTVGYTFPAFILPVLYGSWRITLYHFLIGPALAYQLTDNPNEWPAIWCLFSIGLLLIMIKTPIRRFLAVKKFYFWNYFKSKSAS